MLGARAKLTVAVTDQFIYADVSGAVDVGDNLRLAGELSPQSAVLERQGIGTARLRSLGADRSLETWGVRNCAEFRVCNRVFLNGQLLDNVREMYTVDLRTWQEAPRCRNCLITSREVKAEAIESDTPGSFHRRRTKPYRVRTAPGAGDPDFPRAPRPGTGNRGGGVWRSGGTRGANSFQPYKH